jgi:curved DNA-binding protein CbpA
VSHYDVLGASRDADAEQLRRAFVALARRYHPDRHIGADATTRRDAERRMREITEAWAVLGDPERRRRYDQGLGDRARPASSTGQGPVRSGTTSRQGGSSGPSHPGGPRPGASRPAAPRPDVSSEGRHWRHYAPGSSSTPRRRVGEQLLLLSPVALVATAGVFAFFGLVIGWPPFFGISLSCLIAAAAAFFMLPIWAMTRGSTRRGGRRQKRAY